MLKITPIFYSYAWMWFVTLIAKFMLSNSHIYWNFQFSPPSDRLTEYTLKWHIVCRNRNDQPSFMGFCICISLKYCQLTVVVARRSWCMNAEASKCERNLYSEIPNAERGIYLHYNNAFHADHMRHKFISAKGHTPWPFIPFYIMLRVPGWQYCISRRRHYRHDSKATTNRHRQRAQSVAWSYKNSKCCKSRCCITFKYDK